MDTFVKFFTTREEYKKIIDRFYKNQLTHNDRCTVASAAIIAAKATTKDATDMVVIQWCKAMGLASFKPYNENNPADCWEHCLNDF